MPSIVEHTTNQNCRDPREAERASGAAANSTSAALPGAGSSEKEPRRSWFGKVAALGSCKTFWAIAAFLGLSQIMSALQVGALSPQDVPYPTWTSWAISDFMENAQKRPDFVFLGSSLMLVPLDGVDADYTRVALDGSKHHKSIFFEEKFKQYSGEKVDSFNFALPGEMPSDAFLITKFLLRDEHRPHVIVYGVGPRDFMDNLLPSPSATDPFRYLSRFGDYQERINLIAPEWQDRLTYELGRCVYPLGQSMNITTALSKQLDRNLQAAFPTAKAADIHTRRLLLPQYHPFEIQPGECWFRPTDDKTRPGFADNIDEYAKRYKELKWKTFLSQMQFLEDILTIAQERGTHVVLVAMPITEINRKLISDEAWRAYKASLEELAFAKGATLIDMHETKAFPMSDFQDTVHLHSGGGKRFLDMLARRLSLSHSVMSAINTDRSDEDKQSIAGIKKESQL